MTPEPRSSTPESGIGDRVSGVGTNPKPETRNPNPDKRVRIGEILLEEGTITAEQLKKALTQQKESGRMLGEVLVEQGVIEASVLVQALARRLGFPGCHLRHGLIDPLLLKMIGEDEAIRLKAIPLFKVRDTLTVA